MTQTVAMESLGDRSREKNRMSVNTTTEIDYSVEIEYYTGSKKPEMPAAKAKKSVPTLKFLAIMEISLNRTDYTDSRTI